jgi:hypothetical protein
MGCCSRVLQIATGLGTSVVLTSVCTRQCAVLAQVQYGRSTLGLLLPAYLRYTVTAAPYTWQAAEHLLRHRCTLPGS